MGKRAGTPARVSAEQKWDGLAMIVKCAELVTAIKAERCTKPAMRKRHEAALTAYRTVLDEMTRLSRPSRQGRR